MNKKAQTLSYILYLIIALLVVFIAVKVYYNSGNYFKSNADLIPNFNDSVQKVSGIEIIRYDIVKDALQYYDSGYRWQAFPGTLSLDEKDLSYVDAHNVFVNYYIKATRKSLTVKIDNSNDYVIFESVKQGPPSGTTNSNLFNFVANKINPPIQTSGGDVVAYLYTNGNYSGWYDVNVNHALSYYPSSGKENRDEAILAWNDELIKQADNWRDSVLNIPVTLAYTDTSTKAVKTILVCPIPIF